MMQATRSALRSSGFIQPLANTGWRALASISASTEVEQAIARKLDESFKGAISIKVKDTSGGCGSFYSIEISADEFKGKSIIKQHQLVHDILKHEMAEWHGCNLATRVPSP